MDSANVFGTECWRFVVAPQNTVIDTMSEYNGDMWHVNNYQSACTSQKKRSEYLEQGGMYRVNCWCRSADRHKLSEKVCGETNNLPRPWIKDTIMWEYAED